MSLQQWIDYSFFNHVCMTLAWEIYQLSRRTPQQTSRLPKTSAEVGIGRWFSASCDHRISLAFWLFPGIDGNNQSGDWIISTVGFLSRFPGTSSNICHEVVGSSMFLPTSMWHKHRLLSSSIIYYPTKTQTNQASSVTVGRLQRLLAPEHPQSLRGPGGQWYQSSHQRQVPHHRSAAVRAIWNTPQSHHRGSRGS